MNAQVGILADGKAGVVVLEGEVDFSVLDQMRKAIGDASASNPSWLFVDLSAVSFIASDGLGVLIESRRNAQKAGQRLDLIHPQPHILGMLRKTQLTKLFQIHASLEAALAVCR
jgi:anti-sigma B factor antagonist